MKQALILLCILFTGIQSASAQEKIYLKHQKDPIDCKVLEINSTEIKYAPSDADGLQIGVSKNDVYKIVFKSGRVQYFTDPLQDFSYYKGQKRWIGKFGVLSPAFGFTDLYLEKSVKPGKSVEFQVNIIGLGQRLEYQNWYGYGGQIKTYVNQRGASIGAGIKFLKMPDFETSNRKLVHILQGSYLKPTVSIGMYQRDFFFYETPIAGPYNPSIITQKKNVFTSQIALQTGKQWILDNTFCIDLYALVGLGIDNFRQNQNTPPSDVSGGTFVSIIEENMPYSNFGATRIGKGGAGLILGGGIKMGFLFNTKKTKDISGLDATRRRLSK